MGREFNYTYSGSEIGASALLKVEATTSGGSVEVEVSVEYYTTSEADKGEVGDLSL